jgi:hypothetical protein
MGRFATIAVGCGLDFTVVSAVASRENMAYFKNIYDFGNQLVGAMQDRVAKASIVSILLIISPR